MVQGTISYPEVKGIPYFKVSHTWGYGMLKAGSFARKFDVLVEHSPSSCPRIIRPQKLKEIEEISENEGIKELNIGAD
jgi:hypothetical protein